MSIKNDKIGMLVLTIKKDKNRVVIELQDGRRIIVEKGNQNRLKFIADKAITIRREELSKINMRG
jgi:sRNA-binding carbon storage regulator CsrA